jgi:hypothetical protein
MKRSKVNHVISQAGRNGMACYSIHPSSSLHRLPSKKSEQKIAGRPLGSDRMVLPPTKMS